MSGDSTFVRKVRPGYKIFAYIIDGDGYFEPNTEQVIGRENLVIFHKGEKISIICRGDKLRFLLVSRKPIDEPVAWYGPIVMNTERELELAFSEYREGTLIKNK